MKIISERAYVEIEKVQAYYIIMAGICFREKR
jgi:hypothetical protein